jgi:hypothetical protein
LEGSPWLAHLDEPAILASVSADWSTSRSQERHVYSIKLRYPALSSRGSVGHMAKNSHVWLTHSSVWCRGGPFAVRQRLLAATLTELQHEYRGSIIWPRCSKCACSADPWAVPVSCWHDGPGIADAANAWVLGCGGKLSSTSLPIMMIVARRASQKAKAGYTGACLLYIKAAKRVLQRFVVGYPYCRASTHSCLGVWVRCIFMIRVQLFMKLDAAST